jgi:phage shock protein E
VKKLIKPLLLSFLVTIFVTSFISACGQAAENKTKVIFSSGTILIDVRTPMEFKYDHLKKAVNIPLNTIKEDIKYFAPDKQQAIAVYCTTGKRSGMARKELEGMGYKNVINAGKFKELKEMEEKWDKENLARHKQ